MTEKVEKEVNIFYEDTDFLLEDSSFVARGYDRLFEKEGRIYRTINVILCSDDYLLGINRKYLDHDFYTDIVTFPISTDPISADIFISVDRVRDNAGDVGVDFLVELQRVLVHGGLHLCGYNDKTAKEQQVMRTKEDESMVLFS